MDQLAPLLRLGGTLLILEALRAGAAWACLCAMPGDAVDEASNYEEVFVGEARRTIGLSGCDPGRATTRFRVIEAFKGVDEGDTVRVRHATMGPECGLTFERGEEWLLYVRGGEVSRCSPGGLAEEVPGDLEDLRETFGR